MEIRRGWIALVPALGLVASVVGAGESEDRDAAEAKSAEASSGEQSTSPVPVFVPIDRGAPSTRVGGATRGIGSQPLPSIDALVPDQPGYTLNATPQLYWHLSDATDMRIDFVLIGPEGDAVVETTLTGPFAAGVQVVDLGNFGVELESGVTHTWYVSLVPDPDQRSRDRLAGGTVGRIDASEGLRAELAGTSDDRRAFVLAGAGLWYDALAVLSERIETTPRSPARGHRAALLEQVGLPGPASYDRARLAGGL